jgi:hypothetical protein
MLAAEAKVDHDVVFNEAHTMITSHTHPEHVDLPDWLVATLQTAGWAVYLGALTVLGSFGVVAGLALVTA